MQVNNIAEEHRGTGKSCCDAGDYNTLMTYLMSVLIFSHFQWPSVVAKMTVEDFVRGRKASDGRIVILIYDHKTGVQGPAQVTLGHNYSLICLPRGQ